MKKRPRKLVLSKTTLRALSESEAAHVRGGALFKTLLCDFTKITVCAGDCSGE